MAMFLNIFASFLYSVFYKFCIWIKMHFSVCRCTGKQISQHSVCGKLVSAFFFSTLENFPATFELGLAPKFTNTGGWQE